MIDTRYQVISVIGRGGFGCVYKVQQVLLRKEFAIKTLNPVTVTEVTMLRLRKEAHAASKLEHPNLVKAVDFGMINGSQPYLVMDLVEGPTLADYLREHGRLSIDLALEIFIPLAKAMAYAHHQGVIHRDLKPGNVILAGDKTGSARFTPKIVDFGIAKIQFADESRAMSLTSTGDIFGTPLYMSPEQCAGSGVDARSDIYSLGCMLFEALTGAPPFSGRNSLEVMMQHGSAPLPSLKEASLGESFPPELERIISSMLAKLPDERYSNAQKVADDLFWLKHGDYDRISTIAQTGAVLTRQQASKQHALSTALIALSCTTIGATIGFGLALCNRPPEHTKAVSNGTEFESKSLLGADVDYAYLSTAAEDARTRKFVFPFKRASTTAVEWPVKISTGPCNDEAGDGWGSLHWWNSNTLTNIAIPRGAKPFSVPNRARLIFRPGFDMFIWPYTWARFRPDELYGVIISKNTCSFKQSAVGQVVRSLSLQDDVHILSLDLVTLTPQALRTIGEMSSLRWLDLTRVWLESGHGPYTCPGEEIAGFSYLSKLRVLRLEGISNHSAVLKTLAKQNDLRWLSLADDNCSDQDLKLIGQFRSLETLNIRGSSVHGLALLDALAQLKNLKKLVIDLRVLEELNPEQLRSLKGMTIMIASSKKNPPSQGLLNNLKGCVIKQEFESGGGQWKNVWVDRGWFDSLQIDPAQVGL
jgi:serine/threonine protein kinase